MRLGMVAAVLSVHFIAVDASANDGFATLDGHGGPVHDVAISGDGQIALTSSFDNSVGLWDLGDGSVRWLQGHEAAVKSVVFNGPDRAISGGDDFAILLWDLVEAKEIARIDGHKGQVTHLAINPKTGTIASASWDGSIGLWTQGGKPIRFLIGHESGVNAVAWLDQATLLSASADGTIRSWDAETGDQTRILVRHGFGVTSVLANPSSGWLVYGGVDGGTRALDLRSGDILADLTLDRRPILDIAANSDFSQVAVGDGEGHIMIVNTRDWRIVHDFRAAKRGPIWALAYDGQGRLLTGGIDDRAYFWPIGEKSAGPIVGNAERDFHRAPNTMSNGERQFQRKCSICHSLSHDGIRRAGPPLAGIFGRRAGTYPGYFYSKTVGGSDIVWNAQTIDELFEIGPDHYIPGTKMPMQVIAKAQDRADLIAFLRENTAQ